MSLCQINFKVLIIETLYSLIKVRSFQYCNFVMLEYIYMNKSNVNIILYRIHQLKVMFSAFSLNILLQNKFLLGESGTKSKIICTRRWSKDWSLFKIIKTIYKYSRIIKNINCIPKFVSWNPPQPLEPFFKVKESTRKNIEIKPLLGGIIHNFTTEQTQISYHKVHWHTLNTGTNESDRV